MEAAAQLQALLVGLGDIRVTQYMAVSAVTLWAWEWLLNLGEEIEFVWTKSLLQWGQILYILNRYVSGFILILGVSFLFRPIQTTQFCQAWVYWAIFSGMGTVMLVQTVLMVRVCAIYGQTKVIQGVVLAGIIAEIISVFVFGLPIIRAVKWSVLDVPQLGITSCVPTTDLPRSRWEFWIIPLVFDFMLFVLVLIRGWNELTRKNKLTGSLLLRLIVRDSTMIFIYNLVAQSAFIFLWRFARSSLAETPSEMENSIDIVFATRMLLNLWEKFYATDAAIFSTRAPHPSQEVFAMATIRNGRKGKVYDTFWAMQEDDDDDDDVTLRDDGRHITR